MRGTVRMNFEDNSRSNASNDFVLLDQVGQPVYAYGIRRPACLGRWDRLRSIRATSFLTDMVFTQVQRTRRNVRSRNCNWKWCNCMGARGPFPCGSYADPRIFRSEMKQCLQPNERVIADRGYPDDCCITPTNVESSKREEFYRIRACQETASRRLKQFCVLGYRFRPNVRLHSFCFHAVANLTQLMVELEEPLFRI